VESDVFQGLKQITELMRKLEQQMGVQEKLPKLHHGTGLASSLATMVDVFLLWLASKTEIRQSIR
jgi:hypothetical protein